MLAKYFDVLSGMVDEYFDVLFGVLSKFWLLWVVVAVLLVASFLEIMDDYKRQRKAQSERVRKNREDYYKCTDPSISEFKYK